MTRPVKYSLWIIALIFGVAGFLYLADPFLPITVAFGTEDVNARAMYESIVKAHGYEFHYEKNHRGETYEVINDITQADTQKIRCEYQAWDNARTREMGTTVYESEKCL